MDAVQRYFVPVNATNSSVAEPIPMVGESKISGFKFAEQDGHIVVKDVPVFDEHKNPNRRAPFDDVTGETFDRIFSATKDAESRGAFAALIVGHTDGSKDDDYKDVVGHAKNFRLDGSAGSRMIVADMYFRQEFFQDAVAKNRFPRRSPEISGVDFRMDPIALLGAPSPARPLPDLLFQKCEDREVFMSNRPERATFTQEHTMSKELEDRISALEALPERFGKLEKLITEKFSKGGEGDDAGESTDGDKGETTETETPAKFSSDDQKERFAQVEAENSKLKDQLEATKTIVNRLEKTNLESDVDSRMERYKASGVIFGTADEEKATREQILAMPDKESRERFFGIIETRFARAPVGTRINREGMELPQNDDAEVSYADQTMMRAEKYAAEHGVSLTEAVTKING